MQARDIAEVLAIDASSFHGRATTEARLRAELARPWARIWIVREGQQVTAFLIAWHVADEVHVIDVATSPEHRRRGHARALMQHLIAFAKNARARLLLLEVRPSNEAAVSLYRSFGFSAFNRRRGYYSDGEDALEMKLTFDPETPETGTSETSGPPEIIPR